MRLAALFMAAVLLLPSWVAEAADRRTLTLAYDTKETWPWHLGIDTVSADMKGVSLDLIEEAARRLDVEVKFVRAPFRRALAMLKEGEVDGLFEASFRPERLEFGAYPTRADGSPDADRSMFVQSYVFYVRREENRIRWDGYRIEGVSGVIGALRNTSAAADLTARGYPVFEVSDNLRALEMLAMGRLDVMLLLDNIGTAVFSRRPDLAKALRTLEPAYETKPYYLMLSHRLVREEPDFADALWREIAAVARSPFAEKRLDIYEQALAEDKLRAWSGDPPIPTDP